MKQTSTGKVLSLLLLFSALTSVAAAEHNAAATESVRQQEKAQRYLRLGILAQENSDDQAAVEFLTNALNGPQQPAAMRQTLDLLHKSLLRTGKMEDAAKILQQAEGLFEFQDFGYMVQLMRSRSDFAESRFAQVITTLSELTVPAGDRQHLCEQQLLLAQSYSRLGKHAEARKSFEKLYRNAGTLPLKLTGQEGILLNSLDLRDFAAAGKALAEMQKLLKNSTDIKLQQHLKKLEFLVACSSNNAGKVSKDFHAFAAKTAKPDALIARTAALIADDCLLKKDFAGAVSAGKISLDFAGKDFQRTALVLVIECNIAAGKLEDALTYIQNFQKLYPLDQDHYKMALLTASLYTHIKKNDMAINVYKRLYADQKAPENVHFTASLELAKLYQKSNKPQQAVDHFIFAINHAPDRKVRIGLEHRLGEYLYQLGRYTEAVKYFSSAAAAGATRSGLWLAQTHYQLKNYTAADKALKMFTGHGDADLERRAAYLQALLTERLKSRDAAIRSYTRFVDRYPKSAEAPEALFQAAVLAQGSTRYQAYKLFERYAANYPGERAANALYKALQELISAGNEEASENILQKLISTYPESKFTISGHFAMISYLRRTNRPGSAMTLLDDTVKRYQTKHPDLIPEILYERSLIYYDLKDYQQMHNHLENLLKNHASHGVAAQAFYMLGDYYLLNGSYQKALAAFQQAQERSGGGNLAYGCIGRTADTAYALYSTTRQKQYLRQAAESYEKLLNINDLPPEFYFQSMYKLGNCRRDSGNQAAALRCYREVVYRSLLARRENRFYSPQWCGKALDGALKLLLPAIKNATNDDEKMVFYQEAEQLLNAAETLDLPGEDIKQKQEALQQLL